MQYGLLESTERFLVSVTFRLLAPKQGKPVNYVSVEYAEKAWLALLRLLKKRDRWRRIAWFRVVELTRKGQIHFHILMVNIDPGNKYPKGNHGKANWTHLQTNCICLRCDLSNLWYKVTKDSYVVDVTAIYDPSGAAWYLCKYLKKGMYGKARYALEARGYKRRYWRSNNWVSDVQLRRKGTIDKVWQRVTFAYGGGFEWLINHTKDHPMLEQIGTDLAKDMAESTRRNKSATFYEKVRNSGRRPQQ